MAKRKRGDPKETVGFERQTLEGLPIEDATDHVIISVLPKDISNAKRRDSGDCALARAIMRTMHATEVRVHLSRTYVKQGKVWQRFDTPAALRTEMASFDRGGTFEPG